MDFEINTRKVAFVPHALAIVATMMVLYWSISYRGGFAWDSNNKSLIFNLHPVLMLIGLVILGGEAIISYKSLPFEREMKKKIHFVLHAIAFILGSLGIYVAIRYHDESNIPDLYSLHSWIGAIVIFLYLPLLKYSFVFFFFIPSTDTRDLLPPHASIGLYIFVLAVGNSVLGFVEKLTSMENSGVDKYGSEAFLVNSMAMITILFGTFVIFIVSVKSPPSSGSINEDNDSYSAI